MRHFIHYIILISVVLLCSCNKNRLPEGVLDEKTMVDLLSEMHTADAFFTVTTDYESDTMIGQMNYTYDQIFKRHGTTKQAFEQSLEYYSKNPKKYRDMYEKVVLKLNQN